MRTLLRFSLFALTLITLSTCAQQTSNADAGITGEAVPAVDVADSFGAKFQAEEVIPADQLMTKFNAEALADTVKTTLRGEVNEVCQAKGCWMTINAGTEEEMMVKFKDYGFFMPMDISGREVVMNGIAYYQVTPVDELRHYAEDAGKSPEEIAAITDPKKELRFLADGVQLLK
ncbi:DUF4920 domain-containing protein [Lewinella sp. 4G2]|uniref:DUF4920 domain-containing protein n=1 Tax=Lewinella sp. 4G2 TaxID=1803372 RepID=UPI0007E04909|nr:DUF4920 domain-containing protein [Lewinella sp. 4G2]OAV46202.1 DUF4920 domain-containing protein [Lewinella sp. 4G2]